MWRAWASRCGRTLARMRPKSSLPPRKKASPAPAARAAGQIRIIGGQWRRTPIAVPDHPGLRPTPDRVRETLFNWLGQDLSGWRCVDAFAGTGALGLEAASRGAAQVLALEQSPELVQALRRLGERLQAQALQVQRGDALSAMQALPAASYDLVFLDPPFDGPWFGPALQAAARLVPVGGWVYLEAPEPWGEAQLAPLGLQLQRQLRAGAVHAHLLQRVA